MDNGLMTIGVEEWHRLFSQLTGDLHGGGQAAIVGLLKTEPVLESILADCDDGVFLVAEDVAVDVESDFGWQLREE